MSGEREGNLFSEEAGPGPGHESIVVGAPVVETGQDGGSCPPSALFPKLVNYLSQL